MPSGDCDCHGSKLDACGVCGGQGIPFGECDCKGNVADNCGVCGGPGVVLPFCDCNKNKFDSCGVCGGDGADECGVCGGTGKPDGWFSCTEETDPNDSGSDTETGGPDEEIKKRVIEEGGTYYDTWIRITLFWENCNDLDLSVTEPDFV